jgi:hypothetical protein
MSVRGPQEVMMGISTSRYQVSRALVFVALVLLPAMAAVPAFAQGALVVDDDGQGSVGNCDAPVAAFASVDAAIVAAAPGETVLVCPGLYVGPITFFGKAITVVSAGGPDVTVLDGNAADSVVTFASGEGPGSVLDGFTIRNGRSGFDTPGFGDGGGVRVSFASPTIRNNVIVGNLACSGGGIAVRFGSPIIESNRVADNRQVGCSGGIGGGGIVVGGAGSARIIGNVIQNNTTSSDGGGISLFAAGTPVIERNVIVANTAISGGGIVLFNQSDATIVGNLIVRNGARSGGGLFWLVPSGARGPLVFNNTIADNDSLEGSAIFADGFDIQTEVANNIIVSVPSQAAVSCGGFNDTNAPRFRFNDVFSATGRSYEGACADQTGLNGNTSVDPLFADSGAANYRIRTGSPAIDAGDNNVSVVTEVDIDNGVRILDGDGNGTAIIDLGAAEFPAAGATVVRIDIAPGVFPPRASEESPHRRSGGSVERRVRCP